MWSAGETGIIQEKAKNTRNKKNIKSTLNDLAMSGPGFKYCRLDEAIWRGCSAPHPQIQMQRETYTRNTREGVNRGNTRKVGKVQYSVFQYLLY